MRLNYKSDFALMGMIQQIRDVRQKGVVHQSEIIEGYSRFKMQHIEKRYSDYQPKCVRSKESSSCRAQNLKLLKTC